MTSLPGPQTFPCAAAAATCTASRATCRRLLASGLSATARTARRSRIFSSAPTCSMLPAVRTSFRCHRVACNLPPARMHCGACASPKKFSGGTRIVAKLRSPMAPATPRFPVIGVIHSFIDFEAYGRSRDEILGTPLCRIHERSAVGPLPADAPRPAPLGIFAQRAAKALGWWMRGLGGPNPLFDDRTDAPLSAPRVVTLEERAVL